jgi:hypothetical protein
MAQLAQERLEHGLAVLEIIYIDDCRDDADHVVLRVEVRLDIEHVPVPLMIDVTQDFDFGWLCIGDHAAFGAEDLLNILR